MSFDATQDDIPRSSNGSMATATQAVIEEYRQPDGNPDPVRCGTLLVDGRGPALRRIRESLHQRGATDDETVRASSHLVLDAILDWQPVLTGAETVAVLLAAAGVCDVFAYPGTSELALCDAIDHADGIRLINGRGDKESAFMAAGASLLQPNRGAAILHGARGLTNAAGGVADARRNEAGTVFIVGLPSTGSAKFLPPHGEEGLFQGMGQFADWSWEAPAVPEDAADRHRAAVRFVSQLRHGLASAAEPPHRPAIFGIPQDVAERRWIGIDAIMAPGRSLPASVIESPSVEIALRALRNARHPLFLIDDYALRHAGIHAALDEVSRAVGGAVLQLRYRRGPMMFERLRRDEVENFVGWLNQFSPEHMDLLSSCDLLVTVEDRNLYERVVGRLPYCQKVAINSDPAKVLKNGYLGDDDVLLAGNPAEILAEMADRLPMGPREPWFQDKARAASLVTPEPAATEVVYGRRALTGALADLLATWRRPVLIDDSQMFGGLLSEHYDDFPPGLRVFGGHGGFVGGGLAYAVGLATSQDDVRVMCTLGDQGFTNSMQGLVAAVQQQARVLFVLCNNGESVSLKKQAAASFGAAAARPYLSNVKGLRYHQFAEALGVPARRIEIPVGGPRQELDSAVAELSGALKFAEAAGGPALVEIVLPSDPQIWRGIWITQGFEQTVAAVAS